MNDADGEWLSLEQLAVRNWRFDEARKAGLSGVEAMMFAESDRSGVAHARSHSARSPGSSIPAVTF